jgi:hypothetical protein
MLSRLSISEVAHLGMITIIAGEINHLSHPLGLLGRGQDLPHGGEVAVVIGIKDFSFSESSAARAGGNGWPTAGGA